jgi:2-oxoisovalerate dehydrogenase E1 component
MKHTPSLDLYRSLFLPRAVEERMLIALRQGRISKWFSSYGQEAVSVGTALAMHEDEWICTMHRNLGVFTARNLPLTKLFAQFQGRATGYTKPTTSLEDAVRDYAVNYLLPGKRLGE